MKKPCSKTIRSLQIMLLILAVGPCLAFAKTPEVVKVTPANGDMNVNPDLREIVVVFDQDMSQDGHSICGGGPNFPKIIGTPRWKGRRSFAMRVKLLPEHDYQFSVNCPSAKNFRSSQGQSVQPYPVRFRTRSRAPGADVSDEVADNAEAVRILRAAIKEKYSYRDHCGLDWDKMFERYGPLMEKAKTAEKFAQTTSRMLARAKDVHLWVKLGDKPVGGFKRKVQRNYNTELLKKIVPGWRQVNSRVNTGKFDDGIGYIMINNWSRSKPETMKAIFKAIGSFKDCKGLIIDVRPNSGGAEPLAQEVAGCFIDKPVVYASHAYRSASSASGFGKVSKRMLKPAKQHPKYRGKIAVLMGQTNMSSCEAFLLMMKKVPGCKLIGRTSYGSSGNSKPVDFGNGVTVWLPSWKAMRPDGSCFEGEGLRPDMPVRATPKSLRRRDRVLETALKHLRSES